jgi:putative superfamily III holin-X
MEDSVAAYRAPARAEPIQEEPLGTLVSRLGNDVGRIVRAELGLVQVRALAAGEAVQGAALWLGIGIVLALAGLGALTAAAVAGLALVVPTWLAALIVGATCVVLGTVALLVRVRTLAREVRDAVAAEAREVAVSAEIAREVVRGQ